MNKIFLLLETISFLKLSQVYYRVYFLIKNKFFKKIKYDSNYKTIIDLKWENNIYNSESYFGDKTFCFLNIKYSFSFKIKWNYSKIDKLWLYNLNYFDYLNQKDIDKKAGLYLIKDFIKSYNKIIEGKESYPTSVRIINWIKFVSKNKINDNLVFKTLYEDSKRLFNNIEYHILGNHILENGFALFFASNLFNDSSFLNISKNILTKQLNEQILNDGAHFELSPMYHNHILYRILDCIALQESNNKLLNKRLLKFLKIKTALMLSWVKNITYSNGDYPLLNDSILMDYSLLDIIHYADKFNISIKNIKLSDSGYRKWILKNTEIIIDIGKIGPDYIPAHAHADTFNFELNFNNKPVIVDPSISTYHNLEVRNKERSTEYHNTILIDNKNSSQVWSKFRVGSRAKVYVLEDSENIINVYHDGYRKIKCFHNRSFLKKNNVFQVVDIINHETQHLFESNLHFHPQCNPIIINNNQIKVNNIIFHLSGYICPKIKKYKFSMGFNKRVTAYKLNSIVGHKSSIKIILN